MTSEVSQIIRRCECDQLTAKAFSSFRGVCVYPRVCACGEGVRSRFWELQTVELNANPLIKETVCGYLGKKCLGMHGGVGWGWGTVHRNKAHC